MNLARSASVTFNVSADPLIDYQSNTKHTLLGNLLGLDSLCAFCQSYPNRSTINILLV